MCRKTSQTDIGGHPGYSPDIVGTVSVAPLSVEQEDVKLDAEVDVVYKGRKLDRRWSLLKSNIQRRSEVAKKAVDTASRCNKQHRLVQWNAI